MQGDKSLFVGGVSIVFLLALAVLVYITSQGSYFNTIAGVGKFSVSSIQVEKLTYSDQYGETLVLDGGQAIDDFCKQRFDK